MALRDLAVGGPGGGGGGPPGEAGGAAVAGLDQAPAQRRRRRPAGPGRRRWPPGRAGRPAGRRRRRPRAGWSGRWSAPGCRWPWPPARAGRSPRTGSGRPGRRRPGRGRAGRASPTGPASLTRIESQVGRSRGPQPTGPTTTSQWPGSSSVTSPKASSSRGRFLRGSRVPTASRNRPRTPRSRSSRWAPAWSGSAGTSTPSGVMVTRPRSTPYSSARSRAVASEGTSTRAASSATIRADALVVAPPGRRIGLGEMAEGQVVDGRDQRPAPRRGHGGAGRVDQVEAVEQAGGQAGAAHASPRSW